MQRIRPLVALFYRSVREDTRARLPTILRATLICVILLILWGNERSFSRYPAPGREFFSMVMVLNVAFIGIAALSIFPSAISEEKEDETLPLLRMTNLSPVAILFGKSTSRLAGALMLLAVQVPFTILAITLGGVSLTQVWSAYAILGSVTFFLCNLSLLASVYSRTTLRAGFLTAAAGLILYVLLPIGSMYYGIRPGMTPAGIGMGDGSWKEEFWTMVLQANPMWAMFRLLGPTGWGGELPMSHIWFNLIGGSVCFAGAWLIFDRFCAQTGEVVTRPKRKHGQGQRHRFKWVPRTWSRLPLAWKDFHFMIGGRFGFFARLVLGAVIYICVAWMITRQTRSYYYQDRSEVIGTIVMAIAGLCAGLEVLLQTGRIFGVERRRQTLSSLVGLPWTTGKIIRQKVLGFLPCLLPWVILAGVGAAATWDSLTRELTRELAFSNFEWENERDEVAIAVYVFLQSILLLLSVVWLSLLLRRGALPAAIALATLWNIVFGVCVDAVPHRDEYIAVTVGIFLTVPVLILVSRGIYLRIQGAAAEDS